MSDGIIKQVLLKAGGAAKLAAHLKIKSPSIYSWKKIPPARVLDVSEITGIPPYELRPDIFPAPEKISVLFNNNALV